MKLDKIAPSAVQGALDCAEHFRLLNQPEEAESIFLDVLVIEPENQRATEGLILSLTDQFDRSTGAVRRARDLLQRLDDEYLRSYYAGLVCERHGRSQLDKPMSAPFAYESFCEAIELYERAAAIRREGNDNAILRRNSCIRTIERHGLEPREDGGEQPLE